MTAPIHLHGYLPNGLSITFILPDADYQSALDYSQQLITQGLLVSPPENEGERTDFVGYIVRREKMSKQDGAIVPTIDLYFNHELIKYRFMTIYLNSNEQIAEFEAATGLRLNAIPLWEGDNYIERGKNPKQEQYVVKLAQPASITFKPNPRYNPEESDITKKKPQWLFVRWNGTVANQQHQSNGHSQQRSTVYDPQAVIAATSILFDHEKHQRNALRQMAESGDIRADMTTEQVIEVVKANRARRAQEKQQQAQSKRVAAQNANLPPSSANLKPFTDPSTKAKFVIACFNQLNLNEQQIKQGLATLQPTLEQIEDYEGSKEDAWAAEIANAAGYDLTRVDKFIKPVDAPELYQKVVDLIEQLNVPF